MGTLKSSDCPLEDRRDSSWLDAARDCHSIGNVNSLRRVEDAGFLWRLREKQTL